MIKKIKSPKYKLKYLPLGSLNISVSDSMLHKTPNVREIMSAIKDKKNIMILADSIEAYGLHMPIIVRPKDDGKYEIIDGQRRVLAIRHMFARRKTGTQPFDLPKEYEDIRVPCLVTDMNYEEAFKLSVEASRTTIKVSSKNLENRLMEEYDSLSKRLRNAEQKKGN
ncbi:MAG: ParB N-terminal domain-containing protein [Nitrososphaerota archaeon]